MIFYIQYQAIPLPESEHFEQCGGAYVNCWVSADSEEEAEALTAATLGECGWKILAVEEPCHAVSEDHYTSEDDEHHLEHYEQAITDGECYVFHQWPINAQEGDPVH